MAKAQKLFEQGYIDLVSVIPPEAPLSPQSKIRPEARGKSPGVRYASGLWGGYAWADATTTAAHAAQMDRDGANVGLRAAKFPAIDLDVRDQSLADLIAGVIERYMVTGPVRVGAWPKRLYPFRLAEGAQPFGRLQLFIEYDGDRHCVEILGAGQQYLVAGTHPGTRQPYEWRKPLGMPHELPTITLGQAEGLLNHITEEVCEFLGLDHDRSGSGRITTRREMNQERLKASNMEMLTEAVRAVPNTNSTFPNREDYIRFGYALRGATQDDPGLGLELYQDWCAKWEGNHNGGNAPERVAADWDRMHAPFELGVDYVIDIARQYGFNSAAWEFSTEPAPPAAPAPENSEVDARYSDRWLAGQFVAQYGGKVRFVPESGKWLAWDSTSWRDDVEGAVNGMLSRTMVEISNQLLREDGTDRELRANTTLARQICSAHTGRAVREIVKEDGRIVVRADRLNSDPDLLGTPGGTVNLQTGELQDADSADLISKTTAVAPQRGPCPKWRKFMREATGGDVELEKYMQRVAGYCLTGLTDEHVLFFLWGTGGNGKSVFVNTLEAAMGGYATTAAMTTFTASQFDRGSNDLASLAGARMVIATEVKEGRDWDEQRIKALTGNDRISARFLFHELFTYQPTFKLLLSGNHKPRISNVDAAMQRRIHLIPFVQVPKEKNLKLTAELRDELPAILAWMIDGAIAWRNGGLRPPAIVMSATKDYFAEEDPVGRWLADSCVLGVGSATSAELFQSWVNWCDANTESAGSHVAFAKMLGNRNIAKKKIHGGRMAYQGIRLRDEFAVRVFGEAA